MENVELMSREPFDGGLGIKTCDLHEKKDLSVPLLHSAHCLARCTAVPSSCPKGGQRAIFAVGGTNLSGTTGSKNRND